MKTITKEYSISDRDFKDLYLGNNARSREFDELNIFLSPLCKFKNRIAVSFEVEPRKITITESRLMEILAPFFSDEALVPVMAEVFRE